MLELRASDPDNLANDEMRTSALLFQLKALLEGPSEKEADKAQALARCAACPDLIAAFVADTITARRSRARRSRPIRTRIGAVLSRQARSELRLAPARTARTPDRLGRVLGGAQITRRRAQGAPAKRSSTRRARLDRLHRRHQNAVGHAVGARRRQPQAWRREVRQAAAIDADFFVHAEAEFALWNMQVRERDIAPATQVARELARDFPDNREVAKFLESHSR